VKNPRRIDLTDEMVVKHNLSKAPPPPDSLFWTMWNSCTQIAQEALETAFIQGIGGGTLDPVRYGGFNVSDAYYCFNGAADYSAAADRAADPVLRAFLRAKHDGYRKYNESFPSIWRVRDPSSIVPLDVCREYSGFEKSVAAQEDPIYSLIVMLPCEYLWAWLAAQLAPPHPQNLYAPWITGNADPGSPYAMGNFLETYRAQHPGAVTQEKAIHIYSRAMKFEQRNFSAAMDEVSA
jgi:thiaminase/transcriptional activator TenA